VIHGTDAVNDTHVSPCMSSDVTLEKRMYTAGRASLKSYLLLRSSRRRRDRRSLRPSILTILFDERSKCASCVRSSRPVILEIAFPDARRA